MSFPQSSRVAVLVAAVGVAAAGCVSIDAPDGEGSTDEPEARTIAMKDVAYSPSTLSVPVGSKVTWRNEDPFGHTVTPTDAAAWGSPGSGDAVADWLGEGDSWSFTFADAGRFEYYCVPHASQREDGTWAGMTGVVIVGGDAVEASEGASPPPPERTASPSAVAPLLLDADLDGVVRVRLVTEEVTARIAEGVGYTFWTFNGTVPGPMIRVVEGDTVEVTLENAASSTMAHSIDLHAVTGPGGGATLTQTAPGAATTFSFRALNPGLYVYHCATPHIPSHVANGMYGLILVEPTGGLPPVDREFYVVQGEIYPQLARGKTGTSSLSVQKLLDERPEYYLMNGAVGALTGAGALKANVGETVRIYFGVGAFVPSNFHVIGEIFDQVYPEGGFPAVHDVQTTLVPAGGATMVEFKVEVPGRYLLVDHALTHAIDGGAVGILEVSGDPNPDVYRGDATPGAGH